MSNDSTNQKTDASDATACSGVTVNPCVRDTDNDGNCHRCKNEGCPFMVFCPAMLDRAKLTDAEAATFRTNSEKFTYTEPWLGTITGWRSKDGTVLIENYDLK